ncbi:MAG: DUF4919 domain-containing protein [Bacteroidia bacterium]
MNNFPTPVRSILAGLFFLFFFVQLHAQFEVYGIELEEIKEAAEGNPELKETFANLVLHPDSTIEIEEAVFIYYSSAYMDGYAPYGEQMVSKVVSHFFENDSLEAAVSACESLIRDNPAHTRPYLYAGIAYDKMGDTAMAAFFFKRYATMLSVPFYSGNGSSADSAFVVRSVDDEYLIMGELGYEVSSQALVFEDGIPFDILTGEKEGESADFYFNIHQPYGLGLAALFGDDNKKGKKKKKAKKKKKKKQKADQE